MMADLMSKLTLRRKGISGTRPAGEERVERSGGVGGWGAMEKISMMIPPPPPAQGEDQQEPVEDEDDWD